MTLAEILAALRAHLDANTKDDDRAALVKTIREDFGEEIATPLIGIGAAKGKGEVERTTLRALTKERDELKAELESAQAHTAELEKKVPDIEAVRLEGREQMRKLQETHKSAIAERDAKVRDSAVKRERARVEMELGKVIEGFAIESIGDKAEKRIRPNEDGSVDLLGSDGVVLGPVTDDDAMKAFVRGLTKSLDPKILLAPGEAGSDVGRRTRGGAGGGGVPSRARVADEDIAEKAKTMGGYGI